MFIPDDTIARLISQFDVISFDVFDTLVCRTVNQPTDVFRYIERVHGIPGFAEARIRAEKLARERFGSARPAETSLEEIYTVLTELLPNRALSRKDELLAEHLFTAPNPVIMPIYEAARQARKRIVAVSDIYLNESEIRGILTNSGFDIANIYSSCDHRTARLGKFNGRMYGHVCEAEGVLPSQVLHFGDNFVSDYQNALASGCMAVHLPDLTRVARLDVDGYERMATEKAGGLSSSIVCGVVRRNLVRQGRSDLFSIGFRIGGPLVLGFVLYILERCRTDGVSRLNLLARDGHVIGEVLDLVDAGEVDFEVVPASRRMFLFPLASDNSLQRLRTLSTMQPDRLSLAAFLDILSLDPASISLATELAHEAGFEEHWAANRNTLSAAAERERKAILGFFEGRLSKEDGRASAWVDVGWSLSTVKAADELFSTRLPGYFVGLSASGKFRDNVHGYLYEGTEPKGLEADINRCLELIEFFFSDAAAQAVRIVETDGKTNVEFATKAHEEHVRDVLADEAKDGILEFVRSVRPFLEGLAVDELRDFNRSHVRNAICAPTLREYETLKGVPHQRLSGNSTWDSIGHFWRPAGFSGSEAPKNWQDDRAARKDIPFGKKVVRELFRPFKRRKERRRLGKNGEGDVI
jgi:FMN phosphatase YigB (HAD superfamily)